MYGKLVDAGIEQNLLSGTYEIEKQLGAGGCGAVYKAWHHRLNKYIVLKELKDSPQRVPEACRNEVEALKNVKNPFIPQVYDYLADNGSTYTVMEYIEGTCLDVLLSQGRLFTAAAVHKAYCCLASALETLHGSGVCHRDIKPSNIMYMPDGTVYLIDYNSALVAGNNTRTVSRSLGYASPEQLEYYEICEQAHKMRLKDTASEQECRKRSAALKIDWKLSDIYSLGASMYHMYTGKRPPVKPGACIKITPPGKGKKSIAAIIERSMQYESAKRYSSAKELCKALDLCYRRQDHRLALGSLIQMI